jgi:hypothetical protein
MFFFGLFFEKLRPRVSCLVSSLDSLFCCLSETFIYFPSEERRLSLSSASSFSLTWEDYSGQVDTDMRDNGSHVTDTEACQRSPLLTIYDREENVSNDTLTHDRIHSPYLSLTKLRLTHYHGNDWGSEKETERDVFVSLSFKCRESVSDNPCHHVSLYLSFAPMSLTLLDTNIEHSLLTSNTCQFVWKENERQTEKE